MIQVLEWTIWI